MTLADKQLVTEAQDYLKQQGYDMRGWTAVRLMPCGCVWEPILLWDSNVNSDTVKSAIRQEWWVGHRKIDDGGDLLRVVIFNHDQPWWMYDHTRSTMRCYWKCVEWRTA